MQKSISRTETPQISESTPVSAEDKNEEFRVHSEKDIIYILRDIMQTKTLLSVYLGTSGSFFLTTILSIDLNHKTMIIDFGANDKLNQLALETKDLIYVTSHNKVKIEFVCNPPKKTEFESKPAFSVAIPSSLLRIQRRDNFRVTTPITKPLKCVIPTSTNNISTQTEITVLDISCGGIGAVDRQVETSLDLAPGTVFDNCQINLPDIGVINTSITIRNSCTIKSHSGDTYHRIGCQFIGLPAKTEAMIQRYIVKQEQLKKQNAA